MSYKDSFLITVQVNCNFADHLGSNKGPRFQEARDELQRQWLVATLRLVFKESITEIYTKSVSL